MKYAVAVLLLFSLGLKAQIGGDHTYLFLNTVTSARAAAQGGSPIANPQPDLNFALLNPALLNDTMHQQISISGVDYMADINYADIAYAQQVRDWGMFFFQMRYFDYGEMDRANELGVRQGTFRVNDYTFNIGYSYVLDTNWSFGAKLKSIFSNYDTYRSSGLALDLGATYKIPQEHLVFSLLFKNMGFQMQAYNDVKESLPFEIQFGISNRFEHVPLRLHLTLEQMQQFDLTFDDPNDVEVNQLTGETEVVEPSIANKVFRHVVIGAEFAPFSGFDLQFGYNIRRREELNLETRRTSAGFSFGAGIRISKFKINYARNVYHVSGAANHISLTTDFQKF